MKENVDAYWALHWEYLGRDIFDEHDTAEEKEYFLGKEYLYNKVSALVARNISYNKSEEYRLRPLTKEEIL